MKLKKNLGCINMNEKEEENKKNLNKLQKILEYLCDIDMLDFIIEDELFYHLYNELDNKYLVDIDPTDSSSFSDKGKEFMEIKPHIVQNFGENFGLAVKDGEYYLLSFDMKHDDISYWYISKMKVDNLETAKKVGSLFELLDDM
jgi:hypothetical protein